MNRLTTGAGIVARRYRIWLTADGPWRCLLRATGGAAALAFTTGICLAAPILAAPITIAALTAAWTAKPDEPDPDDYTPEEFINLLHQLMTETDRAHLTHIAQDLYNDPTATPQVRDLAHAAGITITRGVRVKGHGVSTGIYRKHLPPPVAVVAAGQSDNNNSNTPSREGPQEGFTIIQRPGGAPNQWDVHTHQQAS